MDISPPGWFLNEVYNIQHVPDSINLGPQQGPKLIVSGIWAHLVNGYSELIRILFGRVHKKLPLRDLIKGKRRWAECACPEESLRWRSSA